MENLISSLAENAQFLAASYVKIFPADLLRYLLGAGGVYLIVNLALARVLAQRKIRKSSPDAAQMRREVVASLRTVAVFAAVGTIFVAGGLKAGVIEIDETVARRGWVYFAFNLTALIVLHDAWFYWTHRLIHRPKLFRRFHRLHHQSRNPSPWTAYSFDVGEAVVNAIYLPIILAILPSSAPAVVIFLVHMIVRNAVGHCGYELFPSRRDGRPMFDWLTSVTHHDLHHAQAGWNYGLYFTWWDRLMETEHPLYHEKFAAAVRKPLEGSAVMAMTGSRPVGVKWRGVLIAAPICAALLAAGAPGPSTAFSSAQPPSHAPAGPPMLFDKLWATEGHGAHVEFHPCTENPRLLCGRMVWAWDEDLMKGAQAVALLGDFEWTGEAWAGGWLADPENGRTYRGDITPVGNGALRLEGCAFIFCRSQIWRRVEDIPGCYAGGGFH